MKIKIAVIIPLFFVFEVSAQDTLLLTFNEAIKVALTESYTIKTHVKQKDAMKHYHNYYKAQFKPRLDFSLNAPLWSESVDQIDQADGLPVFNSTGSMEIGGDLEFTYVLPTGGDIALSSSMYRTDIKTVLAQRDTTLNSDYFYSAFQISFDQPLFTKNTLKENLQEAEYEMQKSELYYTRAQMDIVYSVTQGFYNLYKATKEVEIATEKFEHSEESYRIAKLKSESGRIAKADVLSAEVSVARDKANLLKTRNALQNEEDEFKQLVGISLEQPIKIITDLSYKAFIIDEEKAMAEALKNRHEIKEGELDIKLSNIDLDQAEREREFRADLSAYYNFTGISGLESGSNTELMESSFQNITERPANRGVTLTISYPICDWGREKELVKKATLELENEKLELENLKTTIARQVREIVRTVRESNEQIVIHEKNLELARRSYNISRMRFENGDISGQELSIELDRLAEIQLEYLDIFITYQLAISDLKRKTLWDFENNRSYIVE